MERWEWIRYMNMGDKWLPRASSYEVISSRLFLHLDTRVSELIHTENKCWKRK